LKVTQEDPNRTVQVFIDLIQRHEQSFYNFVYKVHSKGEGLFSNLMHWIELFLTIIREGFDHPISLEFLLPHKGKERADILDEVDQLSLYHYKLKLLYEDKIRRRFGKSQGQSDADAEDQATKALVDGVVGEISFNDVVQGDAVDVAAEDSDTGEEDNSDYDSDEDDDEDDSSEEDSDSEESDTASEGESNTGMRQPRRTGTIVPAIGRAATTSRSRPPENRKPMGHQQHPSLPSLKTSKSLTNLSRKQPPSASTYRRSEDLPPVPPLPPNSNAARLANSQSAPLTSSRSKPLPPSPGGSDPGATPAATKPKKRKGKPSPIKRPELVHIPQLLPVFKEMVNLTIFD